MKIPIKIFVIDISIGALLLLISIIFKHFTDLSVETWVFIIIFSAIISFVNGLFIKKLQDGKH